MTKIIAKKEKVHGILELIESKRGGIQELLRGTEIPSVDRFIGIVRQCVVQNPKLLECSPMSILGSVAKAAIVGLEPGGALGHCWLVPFKNQCSLILGYPGLIYLATEAKSVAWVKSVLAYDGEVFRVIEGTEQRIEHSPNPDARISGDAAIMAAYCIAEHAVGGRSFTVMYRNEIDGIMRRSPTRGESGPWKTHYSEMARKTVLRRHLKTEALTPRLADAIGLDERYDADLPQNNQMLMEMLPEPQDRDNDGNTKTTGLAGRDPE